MPALNFTGVTAQKACFLVKRLRPNSSPGRVRSSGNAGENMAQATAVQTEVVYKQLQEGLVEVATPC